MSPLVWDLVHIGNQEERWLVREVGGREPVRSDIDELYDAFLHPRATRPELPLLDPDEAREYVDRSVARLGCAGPERCAAGRLTRGRLRFRHDRAARAATRRDDARHPPIAGGPPPLLAAPERRGGDAAGAAEVLVPAGEVEIGTSRRSVGAGQRAARAPGPRARVLRSTPCRCRTGVTSNSSRTAGTGEPNCGSEPGWKHRCDAELEAPRFWTHDGAGWRARRRSAVVELHPDEPVVHVCFYEAEAFARWAGGRLPTEVEWEKAARWDPATGRSRAYPWGDDEPGPRHANLGQRHLGPAVVGAYPAGASPLGVHQLIGDVWEWTSSPFEPYPGFRAFPYREYSEVFFGGDYRVLRGGSFGTDSVACRGTFRNWDLPIRRQIFAGFRVARARSGGRVECVGTWAISDRPPVRRAGSSRTALADSPVVRAPRHARGRHHQRRRIRSGLVGRRRSFRPVPRRPADLVGSLRGRGAVGNTVGAVMVALRSATEGMPVERSAAGAVR